MLLRSGFELIFSNIRTLNDWNQIIEWANILAQYNLPEEVEPRRIAWLMEAYLELDNSDAISKLVPEIITQFEEKVSNDILTQNVNNAIDNKKFKIAEELINSIEANAGDKVKLTSMAGVSKVKLFCASGRYDEAFDVFKKVAPPLNDMEIRSCFETTYSTFNKAEQNALAEQLSVFVLENFVEKPETHRRGAIRYLNTKAKTDLASLLKGFAFIMDKKVAPNVVQLLCNTHFHKIIKDGSLEEQKEMISICEKVALLLDDEKQIQQIKLLIFDGVFATEDFDKAEELLKAGLTTDEPNWNALALNKLKAHQALLAGNTKEAIERFRSFMDHIEKNTQEASYNPLTDTLYSKEVILGYNSKRIGDILKKSGEEEAAAKAYAEANAYYQTALKDFDEDSKDHKHVQKLVAELPK
jgi:tetratricopeptide (TPR) repeat protein